MATLKLLTNVPLTLTLKYCDVYQSEKAKTEGWAAQLALKGEEGTVYVPLPAGKDLVKIGAIQKLGTKDKYGHPAMKVVGHPRLTILKTEDGKKKLTTITLAGSDGAPPSSDTPKAPNVKPRASTASWERLQAVYEQCVSIARTAWLSATEHPPKDEVLHAAAATLFIEANRQGLQPPPDDDPSKDLLTSGPDEQ